MVIINELNSNSKNKKMKEMQYLENIFPFLMLNSLVLGYIIFRKDTKFIKIFGCLGISMYSYLSIGFYGEEIIFH